MLARRVDVKARLSIEAHFERADVGDEARGQAGRRKRSRLEIDPVLAPRHTERAHLFPSGDERNPTGAAQEPALVIDLDTTHAIEAVILELVAV